MCSTVAPFERMWTRVVDAGNLYELLAHNVEHAARRDVVSILTHERFKFNRDNPTGHYRLDVSKKVKGIVRPGCVIRRRTVRRDEEVVARTPLPRATGKGAEIDDAIDLNQTKRWNLQTCVLDESWKALTCYTTK